MKPACNPGNARPPFTNGNARPAFTHGPRLPNCFSPAPSWPRPERWADSHAEEISDSEIRFLGASADREITSVESRRLSVVISGLVTAFLLGMTSLTLLAVRSCNRAEEERIKAERMLSPLTVAGPHVSEEMLVAGCSSWRGA